MTKNQAIEQLYLDCRFNDCIKKMQPEHLQDDLRNEVALILLTTDTDKILSMQRENTLSFYAIRIILNTIRSNRSPFYKKYRSQFQQLNYDDADSPANNHLISMPDEHLHIIEREIKEMEEDEIYQLINQIKSIAYQPLPKYIDELQVKPYPNISWYKQYILSLYLRLGSFRRIEYETRIPFESCYKTIRITINQLKDYAKYLNNQNPCLLIIACFFYYGYFAGYKI